MCGDKSSNNCLQKHLEKKQYPLTTESINDGKHTFIFLFLSDRLKERWLIGLSDAAFNEQRGQTVGGQISLILFLQNRINETPVD